MGPIKTFLDWLGRLSIVRDIIQYLWTLIPVGWLVGTGVAGYMTRQPVMWIMVAVAASAAFVCVALLAGMMIQIWRDAENKLKFVAANVGIDFAKQRTANATKKKERAQVMMQLRDDAHFPISIILETAESSIDDKKPPRGKFPRPPTLMGPGGIFFVTDDLIDMHQMSCRNLTGDADFVIKYGYPGKEKYELHVKGQISVSMEPNGSIRGIWFSHLI